MSSKGGSAVTERRLRPLWDAIDTRQYKSALKLANSLLTKHPDSVYLIVLKALVLERMGKPEEALSLCDQAKALGPVDDLTLSTLQIVFQRLDRSEQATFCYEHACNKSPNNKELMVGLFNCYVRDYSFLKQQQIAMKMNKIFGDGHFLLWAVCSIQLQVHCGTGDKTLLSLAEALLKKRLDMQGFDEPEALLVYIDLLEHQGRFETALGVLSKFSELFSIQNDRLKLEGKLLLLSRQHERAAEVFREVLETSPDHWATFLQYLNATLEVPCGSCPPGTNLSDGYGRAIENVITSLPVEEAESRLEKAVTLLQKLQNKDKHELTRGPFLGNLEIEKRRFLMQLAKGNNPSATNLHSSFVEYFERFGDMLSFGSDVQEYAGFIKKYCPEGFLERLCEAHRKYECESELNLLRGKVSLFHVEMQLSSKGTASDKVLSAKAIDIARLYVDGLKLSKTLDPQENMHGEELLSMATSFLVQLFLQNRHPGFLIEAILLLELGLAIRKYSFPFKIMLISLYSALFCVSAAFDWYKTLDVKNILLETMPHHILQPLIKSMMWVQLDSTLKDITKFHEDYSKEAADFIIVAYRHCNYSKILEFVQFRKRLQHSHNLLLSKIENNILQLKQKAYNIDEVMGAFEKMNYGNDINDWAKPQSLDSLTFNEALETRPWWSPVPGECALTGSSNCDWMLPQEELKDSKLQRQEAWRQHVRKRSLLPRLLYLSICAVANREPGKESGKPDGNEIQQLTRQYSETLNLQWENVPDILSELSLGKKHYKDLNLDPSDIFSLALFCTAEILASESSTKALLNLSTLADKMVSDMTGNIRIPDGDLKMSYSEIAESWSTIPSIIGIVSEGFTWYSLCLEMWSRNLQPVTKAGKKKKKGGSILNTGDSLPDPDMLAALNSSVDLLCSGLQTLITWLTGLSDALQTSNESIYLELLKGEDDTSAIPGSVLNVVQSTHAIEEVGERIAAVFQTWQPEMVFKKLVDSQCSTLQELNGSLKSRWRALQGIIRC